MGGGGSPPVEPVREWRATDRDKTGCASDAQARRRQGQAPRSCDLVGLRGVNIGKSVAAEEAGVRRGTNAMRSLAKVSSGTCKPDRMSLTPT